MGATHIADGGCHPRRRNTLSPLRQWRKTKRSLPLLPSRHLLPCPRGVDGQPRLFMSRKDYARIRRLALLHHQRLTTVEYRALLWIRTETRDNTPKFHRAYVHCIIDIVSSVIMEGSYPRSGDITAQFYSLSTSSAARLHTEWGTYTY